MVRIHDVAAGGASARPQDGSSEADAMTVRMRAPLQLGGAAARVTPGGRRGAGAPRRRAAHQVRPCEVPPPLMMFELLV